MGISNTVRKGLGGVSQRETVQRETVQREVERRLLEKKAEAYLDRAERWVRESEERYRSTIAKAEEMGYHIVEDGEGRWFVRPDGSRRIAL